MGQCLSFFYYHNKCKLRNGHMFARTHQTVRVSDTTDIFHSTMFIIWAHHMVNFREWVTKSEAFLVKVYCRLCNCENQISSQILCQ